MKLLVAMKSLSINFLCLKKVALLVVITSVKILASLFDQFKLTDSSAFLFTNKREYFLTTSVVPGPLVNGHSHTVVVIILVAWLIGSPLSVSHVSTVWPMKSSFRGDVIQTDPYSTKWVWNRLMQTLKWVWLLLVEKTWNERKLFTTSPKVELEKLRQLYYKVIVGELR